MKKFIWILIGLILCVCDVCFSQERSQDVYRYQISSGVLAQLVVDEGVRKLSEKMKNVQYLSSIELSTSTSLSMDTNILISGTWLHVNAPTQVRLYGRMNKGVIGSPKTFDQMELLFSDWEKTYGNPVSFKGLSYSVTKNSFEDGVGFKTQYALKSQYSYTVLLSVPIGESGLSVKDVSDEFRDIVAGIRRAEKDNRAKVIFSNNESGMPIFVLKTKEGGVEFRHPFHGVTYGKQKKDIKVEYAGPLSKVQTLWEIRQLQKNKELKKFIGEDSSSIRVKMVFRNKKNYSGEWISSARSQIKLISVVKGKLVISNK